MQSGSMPWTIKHPSDQGESQRHPPTRRTKLLNDLWALRSCSHCNENFIPPTDDAEFCSGDCRLSWSFQRNNSRSGSGSTRASKGSTRK